MRDRERSSNCPCGAAGRDPTIHRECGDSPWLRPTPRGPPLNESQLRSVLERLASWNRIGTIELPDGSATQTLVIDPGAIGGRDGGCQRPGHPST